MLADVSGAADPRLGRAPEERMRTEANARARQGPITGDPQSNALCRRHSLFRQLLRSPTLEGARPSRLPARDDLAARLRRVCTTTMTTTTDRAARGVLSAAGAGHALGSSSPVAPPWVFPAVTPRRRSRNDVFPLEAIGDRRCTGTCLLDAPSTLPVTASPVIQLTHSAGSYSVYSSTSSQTVCIRTRGLMWIGKLQTSVITAQSVADEKRAESHWTLGSGRGQLHLGTYWVK